LQARLVGAGPGARLRGESHVPGHPKALSRAGGVQDRPRRDTVPRLPRRRDRCDPVDLRGLPLAVGHRPDPGRSEAQERERHLAEAGYPEGKGFPKYDLLLRAASPTVQTAGEAIQAMIKENLGIDLGVQNQERKLFMDRLNKYELPIVLIPWEYDYYDASNF